MDIISGMHRSGTSLVARLLYEGGGDMGDPEKFYPLDKWNPDGYFEQIDINRINKSLIHGHWWKFSYFWLPSTRTILRRLGKQSTSLQQIALQYEGKVVKDPRFCLSLPAWKTCGTNIERILVCLREPIQVAYSLRKRNHITLKLGLHLWYIHNNRLLQNAGETPLYFIKYDSLSKKDAFLQEMKDAFQFLGYDWSDEKLAFLYTKCVKPNMSHHRQLDRSVYSQKHKRLWEELCRRHAAQVYVRQ